MRALDLKVWREIRHLRGQFFAITLLVSCGTAVFVAFRSMHGYLRDSQNAYYAAYHFGDVFASVKHAPLRIATQVASIPGVEAVDVRIVRDVLVDLPGRAEPATARLVSLPKSGAPSLNRLHLVSGRTLHDGATDEAIISAAFSRGNHLEVNDRLNMILNGRWRSFTIVGTAIAPEFIYEIQGTGQIFPDAQRFGVVWLNGSVLASAFGLTGAFNDVVVRTSPTASEAATIHAIDGVLRRYGGYGAYGRDDHVSHTFVSSEIAETSVTAVFFPVIFLAGTAFLLYNVMARLIAMDREQIGVLKAFGYSARDIFIHYTKIAGAPVSVGLGFGALLGVYFAMQLAGIYARFYQFPEVGYRQEPSVVILALVIAGGAAMTGALLGVRRTLSLHPAIAMRPPSPPQFRAGFVERWLFFRQLSPHARLILRDLLRHPLKTIMATLGIAIGMSIVVAVLAMLSSVDVIKQMQFFQVEREDLAVYFGEPRQQSARFELGNIPGVLAVEPFRSVPVRLRSGHRAMRTALTGVPPGAQMRRVIDTRSRVHNPPDGGVAIGGTLAKRLDVRVGDTLTVEFTEAHQRIVAVPVLDIVDELMGMNAYMSLPSLNRLDRRGDLISGALLSIDEQATASVQHAIKGMPAVAGSISMSGLLEGFERTIAQSFLISLISILGCAGALVSAIVYNHARIALSERARDLGSLRVLGFTRREVSSMLISEQAVLVLIAIPLGVVLGYLMCIAVTARFESDLFRLPFTISAREISIAAALTVGSSAISGLLVLRRLARMDLIEVLKTRE